MLIKINSRNSDSGIEILDEHNSHQISFSLKTRSCSNLLFKVYHTRTRVITVKIFPFYLPRKCQMSLLLCFIHFEFIR